MKKLLLSKFIFTLLVLLLIVALSSCTKTPIDTPTNTLPVTFNYYTGSSTHELEDPFVSYTQFTESDLFGTNIIDSITNKSYTYRIRRIILNDSISPICQLIVYSTRTKEQVKAICSLNTLTLFNNHSKKASFIITKEKINLYHIGCRFKSSDYFSID
jgi:hypothetical protein